jgi:hypothetical protein
MQQQQWQSTLKNLFVQVVIWLVTEALLDLAGLDMLANYSEFISAETLAAIQGHTLSAAIVIDQA